MLGFPNLFWGCHMRNCLNVFVLIIAFGTLNCGGCESEAFVVRNPPLLVVGTDVLDFGLLPLEYTATRKIQLVNAGDQKLVFEDMTITGDTDVFSIGPNAGEINYGESIELLVSFTAKEEKAYEAILVLTSNSRNKTEAEILLKGEGFEEIICGTCDQIPEDVCADENTLLVYTEEGECVEGVCRYVPTEVDCPYGCEDARCLPAPDEDADGILDGDDNCITVPNADQADEDDDGVGDACDNCPGIPNADQTDTDEDGVGDVCDNCVDVPNPEQGDEDTDGAGDLCDMCPEDSGNDVDADGVCDSDDNCITVANPNQTDSNQNGVGDRCELILALGTFAACVKDIDGGVDCWGGGEIVSSVSQAATDYVQIDLGQAHGCGVRQNGEIQCWGAGTTDTGSGYEHGQSMAPAGLYKMVSANTHHSCAVTAEGEVKCWGQGASAPEGTTFENLYGSIPEGPFVDVQVGYRHACALRASGEMLCWGASTCASHTDVEGKVVRGFSLAPYQNCAITEDDELLCWGSVGGFDDGPEVPLSKISVSYYHACALTEADQQSVCWGSSDSIHDRGQMTPPEDAPEFWDLVTAQNNTCAFTMENKLICWGQSNAIQNGIPEIYQPTTDEE